MPKSLEDELKQLKERVELLESIILDGAPVPDPSMERAVEASMRGDWGPFMRINEMRRKSNRHPGHGSEELPSGR